MCQDKNHCHGEHSQDYTNGHSHEGCCEKHNHAHEHSHEHEHVHSHPHSDDHDHGESHAHDGEHEHEHKHVHAHPHNHEDGHQHSHDEHSHAQSHEGHSHAPSVADTDENKDIEILTLLLDHWVAHNKDHAMEYHLWVEKMNKMGKQDVAEELIEAIALMSDADKHLQEAKKQI
ncbi:MAG: hypothetical protein PWP16_144 [Eubacteriaceae bacterium]|jgi:hypothetical protein|nr:hypothetical protein [Eubacteriaceae bacterium]MDK2905588.1 hypothetical protein [Eubacteriaceae bacterium]MDK2937290.1 hypothetical protein [Eubacteriaceae bacterium]MDN5306781.1 hypothetical protein [Eubacteriaceae bacterium]